jgi:ribosomal-protein-alanine N-acetyltransferase
MPDVLAIERDSSPDPWTEEEFIRNLRRSSCIGMVAEYNDLIAGFMIYDLLKSHIHIKSLAVESEFRRFGVGTVLIDKLISKLAYQQRSRIVMEVRESNLPAQLFMRAMNFKANNVMKSFYEDTNEEAYQFVYKLPVEAKATR